MKRHCDDLLPAYLNGTLEEHERNRVEVHLTDCEECRLALEEWRSIGVAMRSAFADIGSIPKANLDRIWATIDETAEERPKARRVRPLAEMTNEEELSMFAHTMSPRPYAMPRRVSPVPWLAAAAVLLLMIGAFAWYSTNPPGGGKPAPMPAVQLASNATPAETGCPEPAASRDLTVTGKPETASAITLPEGPYEGGFHVRPENLPAKETAPDEGMLTAISQTVSELTACMNEGNADATWALTTEDYVRRVVEAGREPKELEARSIVPMVGLTGLETPVPMIRKATVLDDGRVGAEIRPSFDGPAGSFDYYVFVEQGGRWLIDEGVHVQAFVQIEVTVDDSGFTPQELTVPAQSAELVLTNEGTTVHSFVSPEYGIRLEAEPGESVTVSLKGPSGTYPFSSDIPGDDPEVFSGTITFEGMAQPEATPVDMDPAAGTRAIGVPLASVTIHMDAPMSYSPERLAILADRDVEITLVNDGKLESNFTIDELDVSVDLAAGESETITINVPAGAYAFYSTIPGHAQVGMTGVLMVQAESSQP
ncbi:MAG TPA: cupredoxin domain-containing protein [Thermomicrobiales bacterium]|nr:cupredoxin domain-containing protein [Thermomicrobiales bacterium]